MMKSTKTTRARAITQREIPVIGTYRDTDATCVLTRHLLTAVSRCTPRATLVENPAPANVLPNGFYASPLQSLEPRLCPGRVVFTQWETDKLPKHIVATLNTARAVITISPWCASIFAASGVTVPIEHIHLGIDPKVFYVDHTVLPQNFTFLTAGRNRNDLRKGFANVVAAFLIAFPDTPGVSLRVKLGPNDPTPDISSGRIQFIREHLEVHRLAQLYRTANAYVNGSYGEGWGWHMHEALACGTPVISTNWGGPMAYLLPGVNSYAVYHRLVRASDTFGAGYWAEPSIHELAWAMQHVVLHSRDCICKGLAAAESVAHLTTAAMLDELTKKVQPYV